jgi:DNA mismatch repair protein MutL
MKAIQILPARLANQIAAGEVVERPASVVKELVENSLDAGATRIEIDIENGGSKLIRIRDNGQGIAQDELTLALSRHATSKIHTLDDLEAIMSLGFRGEALASISSVSRTTLTSRTVTQQEAWLAYSEGREMDVSVKPASHPVGTTVEVLDLFFNTPARRKFLRTDKTEFGHIDELLRRIALSRFDVTFLLKHNGKLIRQYRAANNQSQIEKRLLAVCGSSFTKHMLHIEVKHEGLSLTGWITSPQGARQQSDLQFCYVNGRMMKDRLINHAIRQSYESSLGADQYPAYVLYIEIDPHQVDVNVHPAKHEVRFHQARLVHDFIYQALSTALVESAYIDEPATRESAFNQSYQPESPKPLVDEGQVHVQREDSVRERVPTSYIPDGQDNASWRVKRDPVSKQAVKNYQSLMQVTDDIDEPSPVIIDQKETTLPCHEPEIAIREVTALGKAMALADERHVVMVDKSGVSVVSLQRALWHKLKALMRCENEPLRAQPLLVPLVLKFDDSSLQIAESFFPLLTPLGIQLQIKHRHSLMVMAVPQPIREQNLQKFIPDLVSFLSSHSGETLRTPDIGDWIAQWLFKQAVKTKTVYTLSEAIQLIAELELLYDGVLPLKDSKFVQPVDFSPTIAVLNR